MEKPTAKVPLVNDQAVLSFRQIAVRIPAHINKPIPSRTGELKQVLFEEREPFVSVENRRIGVEFDKLVVFDHPTCRNSEWL
jgi:hypothetical protein